MNKRIHRYLRKVMVACIVLIAATSLRGQTKVAARTATCDNYLYIRGESNINEFSFYYNSIPLNQSESDSTDDSLRISIPIREFEASNSFMYNDFLELMKEKRHPRIVVSFSRRQIINTIRNIQSCPEVLITIAGVSRKYTVDCIVEKCSGYYYLKGKEIIKLSDFKLKAPARLMGLIKVNNEIDVDFGFIITFAENSKLSATL